MENLSKKRKLKIWASFSHPHFLQDLLQWRKKLGVSEEIFFVSKATLAHRITKRKLYLYQKQLANFMQICASLENKIKYDDSIFNKNISSKQGWPTQIDLWAAFGKNFQIIDFLGRILAKTEQKAPKISKNHRVSIQDWAAEIPFWAAGWSPRP